MGARVAGLLSGTSVDGIDVALADLHLDGDQIVLTPLGALDVPYPADLRAELLTVLPPAPTTAEQVAKLDTRVGQAFAEAASQAIDRFGPADLVASLGQTVFHWVEDGRARGTLQLGQPAWIAERTGLPVVADLRARDIAAGGQGAPLAGTLDRLWLRGFAESAGRPAVALNIGGIANVTVVDPDGTAVAYDTGPGNALLDLAARRAGLACDVDGKLAAQGKVDKQLLARLLDEPYYAVAPPKSTGKELFHSRYLDGIDLDLTDLLATLTELTARTAARACTGAHTVIASGGGADNPALMRALARNLPGITVVTSDDLGLPRAAKESYLTALLGWLTWHGLPANGTTGARGPRLLGSITPGRAPLTLPSPGAVIPARLRVTESRRNA